MFFFNLTKSKGGDWSGSNVVSMAASISRINNSESGASLLLKNATGTSISDEKVVISQRAVGPAAP